MCIMERDAHALVLAGNSTTHTIRARRVASLHKRDTRSGVHYVIRARASGHNREDILCAYTRVCMYIYMCKCETSRRVAFSSPPIIVIVKPLLTHEVRVREKERREEASERASELYSG